MGPSGKFKSSRGLQQGDPLSPFLFNLVADGLSRLVDRAKRMPLFRGFMVGKDNLEVSHLKFANNSCFFVNVAHCRWLVLTLGIFCSMLGLQNNMEKNTLPGINKDGT